VLDLYSPPKWTSGHNFLEYVSFKKGIKWETIKELAEDLEVTNHWNRMMVGYSSGMLKRIALIQALAGDYELLMMDEPFTYLDIRTQVKLIDILTRYKDVSMLISTHYLGGLEKLANEITFIFNGEIIFSGDYSDLAKKGDILLVKTKYEEVF